MGGATLSGKQDANKETRTLKRYSHSSLNGDCLPNFNMFAYLLLIIKTSTNIKMIIFLLLILLYIFFFN